MKSNERASGAYLSGYVFTWAIIVSGELGFSTPFLSVASNRRYCARFFIALGCFPLRESNMKI